MKRKSKISCDTSLQIIRDGDLGAIGVRYHDGYVDIGFWIGDPTQDGKVTGNPAFIASLSGDELHCFFEDLTNAYEEYVNNNPNNVLPRTETPH